MAFIHSPKIVTDGLVLALDAANTKSYPGSGTAWNDLTNNSYNALLYNGPTFDGGNGGSIVFDGVDDYATLGTTTVLQSGLNSSAFSAWWKYLGQGTGLDKRGFVLESANFNYSLLVNINGTLGVHINTTTDGTQYVPGFIPTQGQWYNSAVVWDGANLIVYINGVEVGRRAQIGTSLDASSLRIGTYRDNNNRWWVGNISSISMYNKALTVQEVLQNFNATRSRFGV